ncbi:hypothetical protein Gogos_021443, partial [Gossypium gossypioides]|nr:hypothetical protein [Gossypium gossypioides]
MGILCICHHHDLEASDRYEREKGLLSVAGMVGCLANLYGILENLGDAYILPTTNKDTLSKPKYSSSLAADVPLLLPNIESSTRLRFYRCPNGHNSNCRVVAYSIMDDPRVTAMSTISSITMLYKFNVQQVDALEEKVVD